MQSADLIRASNIILWNKWFQSFLGMWPCKVNQPVFIFFVTYMIIYYIMALGHLIKNSSELEQVIANLTDNVLIFMITGKMIICRRSNKTMTKFLKTIETDFLSKTYDTVDEKTAYLYYNDVALIFVKFMMSLGGFAIALYYFKIFLENWSVMMSGNFSYELPYPVHPFFEIKDNSTYICFCVYLALMMPIILCGYCGPDAFIVSMALHVCGQFAALSCKVNNLLKDHENYHRNINNIVSRHRQLITLAEILENNFNMICLLQTLGTVLLLCFTVYHTIVTSAFGENVNLISASLLAFAAYVCCVISAILAYCYIGECLITESAGLSDAFYNSDWYNNSPSRTKLINICMVRAEKPLMMTGGKFCILSLNTFTSILKTSMAYLSVLRHFM